MSIREKLPSWISLIPRHLQRPLRYRYETFGETVARSRKARDLNQTELATEAGISRTYLSSIERDLTDNLSISILLRLARVLRIDECELFRTYVCDLESRDQEEEQ